LFEDKLFGEESEPVLEVWDNSIGGSPGSITINVIAKRSGLLRNVRLSFSFVE
jgi:hypothetical protein